MTLEDQHGVIHMLAVGAIEEAKLLLAMRGIVGGIDIQEDLAALFAARRMSWLKNSWVRTCTKFISTTGWSPTITVGFLETMISES